MFPVEDGAAIVLELVPPSAHSRIESEVHFWPRLREEKAIHGEVGGTLRPHIGASFFEIS